MILNQTQAHCEECLCAANNSNAQSAAVRQICEADSRVLILAFAFVPRGFSREEIKTKSAPSVPFYLYQNDNGPPPAVMRACKHQHY